jgi:hypothetical protein
MAAISGVCPQVAWGEAPPSNDPELAHARVLLDGCRDLGLDVAGWGWCANAARAEEEAQYHARVCVELGLDAFIANMEEPYDAHGDSSSPRMWAPDYYADAFRLAFPDCELGVTTTPRWASSGNQLRAVGAVIMPQCFTGEIPSATIPAAVAHAEAWGWKREVQRPLVQVYTTQGARPNPAVYNADAEAHEVGVVPYILEQAFDDEGQQMIAALAPSITRPPKGLSQPEPPLPLDLPFARPLYPPDAPAASNGKYKPSSPGPDVEAVQRALARAGYWEWGDFDREYSNEFAHGRDEWEGMEGFQADHVLDPGVAPTGWYGSASHTALVGYVIPVGPNKGQWAFDAYSQDLYRQALD